MTSQDAGAVIPTSRKIPAPGRYMCGLAWDGTSLWHSDQDAGTIYEIDPATGAVGRSFACPRARADLSWYAGRLYQVGGRPKRLLVIDPDTGEVAEEKAVLPSSGRLTGVECRPEGVWMCLREPTVVQLRDYDTLSVEREYPVDGLSPSGLTCLGGVVVHGDFADGLLRLTDARTGEHWGAVPVPGRPTGLTWDGDRLWYCDFPARSFRAVEPTALFS